MANHEANGHFAVGNTVRTQASRGAKQVAKMIMEKTNNLEEVVDFVYGVFKGKGMKLGEINLPPTPQQVQWAAEWLSDHAVGKAPQVIEMTIEDEREARVDYSKISTADLRTIVTSLRDAQVKADPIH